MYHECEIEEFIGYLHNTRGTSFNTEISYERDLRKLEQFLKDKGIRRIRQVTEAELNSYVTYLEREELRLLLFPEVLLQFVHFFNIFLIRNLFPKIGRYFKSSKSRKKDTGDSFCRRSGFAACPAR